MRHRPDVAAIISGQVAPADALWQVGREQMDHIINLLPILRGDRHVWSHEMGGCSTNAPGVDEEHDTKGVRFYQPKWSEPTTDAEREIVWSCTWAQLVDVVRPALTPDWEHRALRLAAARRDATPPWTSTTPDADVREAHNARWRLVEDACHEHADLAWLTAEPAELALF
jgi:hypothetical protein